MNKRSMISILLCLLSVTLFAASSVSSPLYAADGKVPKLLIMATGDPKGLYFFCGKRIEKLMNLGDRGVKMICRSSNGALANINFVASKNADFGFSQYDMLLKALSGGGASGDGNIDISAGADQLSVVTVLFPEVFTMIAGREINSVSQLKGKNISIHLPGSGIYRNSFQVLELAGLAGAVKLSNLNMQDTEKAFMEEKIDGYFSVIGMPAAVILNSLSHNKQSKVIGFDESLRSKIASGLSGFVPYDIPVQTYFNDGPVPTVATFAVIFARKDAPREHVMELLKTIYSLPDFATEAGATGKVRYFSKESAKKFLKGMKNLKIHDSSVEFFGLNTDAVENKKR